MTTKQAAYLRFIRDRQSDFSRLARQTQSEYTAEDIGQEMWLMADSIEAKLGRALDFDSNTDRAHILGWLYNEFVRYKDKTVRFAIKLDKYWEDPESESKTFVFESLLVDEGANPSMQLQLRERADEFWDEVLKSYSQQTAYIILIDRVGDAQSVLAKFLGVALATLRQRIQRAIVHARCQPSLFDGVQKISRDFLPLIYKGSWQAPPYSVICHQHKWAF